MKLDTLLKSSPILQQPASTHESVKVKQPEHPDMQQTINEKSLSKEEAAKLVKGLNDFVEPMHTSIKFELHDKLDRYYVSVIDQNTDEVIKEIPPKKMLDMYAAMAEFMGFIVDEKV
ncbi:flagellar protein FlaG [Allobacillus sp. SKP2-8]|uniref:flagellar protein FlaG n=1 Tax=unclassified Allobacillus TaxID=2628859 RepID=UPI001182E90D|nr:flagellar protein FlaG [Allobacillus sp. SKP2-8]TSJ63721.1 flagellar protein FlaG [Allobacillus sp. SKP2-8]